MSDSRVSLGFPLAPVRVGSATQLVMDVDPYTNRSAVATWPLLAAMNQTCHLESDRQKDFPILLQVHLHVPSSAKVFFFSTLSLKETPKEEMFHLCIHHR